MVVEHFFKLKNHHWIRFLLLLFFCVVAPLGLRRGDISGGTLVPNAAWCSSADSKRGLRLLVVRLSLEVIVRSGSETSKENCNQNFKFLPQYDPTKAHMKKKAISVIALSLVDFVSHGQRSFADASLFHWLTRLPLPEELGLVINAGKWSPAR